MNLKEILFYKMPHSLQYRIPHSGPYTTPRSRAWSKRPPTMTGEEGRDRGAWAGASLSPIIAGFSVILSKSLSPSFSRQPHLQNGRRFLTPALSLFCFILESLIYSTTYLVFFAPQFY